MKQSIKDESQERCTKQWQGEGRNWKSGERCGPGSEKIGGKVQKENRPGGKGSRPNARLFSSLAVGTPSCFRVLKTRTKAEQGTDVPPAPSSRQWCSHRRECNFLLPAKEEVKKIRAFSTGEHFLRYLPQSCRTTLSSESFTCRPPS